MEIHVSTLPHTWIIDIDGTVLRHNGHLTTNETLLPGVNDLWESIPNGDFIILLSARAESNRHTTLQIFKSLGLRYDLAIFGVPTGERILINDVKPGGLNTAIAVNVRRDAGVADLVVKVDPLR